MEQNCSFYIKYRPMYLSYEKNVYQRLKTASCCVSRVHPMLPTVLF